MLIVHIFGKKFAATGKDRAHILVCGLTPFPGRPSHSSAVSPFTPDPSRSFQRFAQLSAAHLTATPTPQMSLDCPCFCNQLFSVLHNKHFLQKPKDWIFCRDLGLQVGGGVETSEGEGPGIPRRGCCGGKAWERTGRRAGERNLPPHTHSLAEVCALDHTQSSRGGQTGPLRGR